jgi:hypothetical protein
LQVESSIAPDSVISVTPPVSSSSNIFMQRVENGGSDDLSIDGSSVPVEFVVNADASDDIILYEVRFVMVVNSLSIDGTSFGSISALTNGVLLTVKSNSIETNIANLQINEDFLSLYSPGGTYLEYAAENDFIVSGMYFGGNTKLYAGSSDFVKITVRDDLSSAAKFKYFTCTVHGKK